MIDRPPYHLAPVPCCD
ncbi:hypothetical protein D033_0748A, partial [Vibrio parahaemolyticus B-265]